MYKINKFNILFNNKQKFWYRCQEVHSGYNLKEKNIKCRHHKGQCMGTII